MRVLIASAMTVGLTACVQVQAQTGAGANDGYDRRVTITNSTKHTMTAFYGSHASTESWEQNILGNDKVAAGESQGVDFEEGNGKCVYDFRAEFADGGVNTEYGVNVCTVAEVEFTQTSN